MTFTSLLIILVVGAIAGWLAGQIFRGTGFGLAYDIVLGIAGGFVGTWLLAWGNITMPGGSMISSILTALLGASLLLLVSLTLYRAFARRRR